MNITDTQLRQLNNRSFYDTVNSTSTTLGASEVFTGTWIHVLHYNTIKIMLNSDVDGVLRIQHSTDRSSPTVVDTINYTGGTGIGMTNILYGPWYRLVYENGAVAQTNMTLSVIVGKY